ncbi:MAG: hypothetical protein QXR62_06585 [Candidatus Bathyarchaeia archaeon]
MNARKLLKIRLNHNAEELPRALGMIERRYSKILGDVMNIFFSEEKYTKAIERVCERYSGNDFILAMIIIGGMIAMDRMEEIEEMLREKERRYID